MDTQLQKQLEELFLAMTRGAARNKIYSLRAQQEGNHDLANLFTAISNSESAQAARFLIQLRGQTGNSEQNCSLAFTDEIPASISLYEQAARQAGEVHDKAMHNACSQSARVQRMHLNLKKKLAQRSQDKESRISYHICQFCGFIMENKAPENCPICTAPASRFQEVTA
ncbi:MAG: rubredoxin-like domain-containing protein [Pseudomonadota bacterium]